MMKPGKSRFSLTRLFCSLALLATMCATGCQVTVGGQTLPSPYYLDDDVQYFAPGPEFGLSREAAVHQLNRAAIEREAE